MHVKNSTLGEMHIYYDGNRPDMVTYNGATYRYVHSLQGDILGLQDGAGNLVVEYRYDAWGRQISKTGSLAATLGTLNPFRYRGYVYGEETGLYYLRSRYYNPNWCRFVSSDSILGHVGGLLQHNLWAYCLNNPVNSSDPYGLWPFSWSELRKRFRFALKTMGRIALSPFKAMTVEMGGGIGFGAKGSAQFFGVPVEVGSVTSITDTVVVDKGRIDVRNTTSSSVGLNIDDVFDFSKEAGKTHSYFDDECTCNFWTSTFGEKSVCPANHEFTSNSATIGMSAGVYFLLGVEGSISIDMYAWNEELKDILADSLAYAQ